MADALSPLPHPYNGLAPTIDDPGHLEDPRRNTLRVLVDLLRRVGTLAARIALGLLRAVSAEAALTLGVDSARMLRFDDPQAAPLGAVIEPPDLAARVGRVVYPGRPDAVVRFTAVMLGTKLMVDYPWNREHGWSARN